MKTFYTLLYGCIISIVAYSPHIVAQTSWEKVYTGTNVRSIEPTADGGYLIAGKNSLSPNTVNNTTQAILHKVNANGIVTWSQTYWNNLAASSFTEIAAALPTADGGVIGVATVTLTNNGFNNFYLFKTDANGQLLWNSSIGDSATYKTARQLLLNSDGSVTMLGESVSSISGGSYSTRTYLIKASGTGSILWQKNFDGKVGKAMAATADGGYVITGGLQSTVNYYQNAYHLWKTDNLGNIVWEHTGDLDVASQDVVVQTDGSIVTVGSQLRKHSAIGDPIWVQNTQSGNSICTTTDGNLVITGPFTPAAATTNQLRLVKVNGSTGAAIWTKSIGITGADEMGYVVTPTIDGGVIAGGNSNANLMEQMYIVKTNSFGNVTLSRPDYVPQNPTVAAIIAPLSTINISCQTKNNGLAGGVASKVQAYLSIDNVLDANDFSLGMGNVTAVSAGGAQSGSISAIFPNWDNGSYFVIFAVDNQKQVFEANESNNTLAAAISLQGSGTGSNADLQISTANLSNTTAVAANSSVLFDATVTNNGIGAAAASTMAVYLSNNNNFEVTDTWLANFTTEALLPTQSQTYSAQSFLIPAGTTAGNYFIVWVADNANVLAETNEANNVFSAALTITNSAADVVVINQTAPATATIGSNIAVSSTINNLSTFPAAASMMKYYLSTDNFFSNTDTYLGESSVASIGANGSASVSQTLSLPTTLVAGTYSLLFVADANNTIAETNENNNVAVRSIILNSTTQADLIVQNALAPATALAGATISLSCKVTNQGGSSAAANQLKFYLSTDLSLGANDILLGAVGIPTLAPAAFATLSANVVIPLTTAPASYYILYRADADQQIAESNENNNNALRSLNISGSLSDLIIQNQSAPISALIGGTITLSCRVRNQGSAVAAASVLKYYFSTDILLSVNDILLGESNVATIAAGSFSDISKSLTLPTTITNGNYYILFQADATTQVAESSETNNMASRAITIGTLPDLACQNLAAPLTANLGSQINVACRVRNQGGGVAAPSIVKYFLSTDAFYTSNDIYLGENAATSLVAGTYLDLSQTVTLPATINAGNYYILFRADASFQIVESNEANNTVTRTISITNGEAIVPDLTPSNLSTPLAATAGDNISLSYVVNNIGTGDAGATVTAFFFSADTLYQTSDILLSTYNTATIVAGGNTGAVTQNVSIPSGATTGNYYILVLTDYNGQLNESNENNNLTRQSISITATTQLPDLITDNILQPNVANVGATVNVSCRVVNMGVANAGLSQIRYYLSANSTFNNSDIYLGGNDVIALNMGNSIVLNKTLSLPSTAIPGTYYILYRTDALNNVPESNEVNNLAATAITLVNNNVEQIDLETTISASPLVVPANSSMTITLTVKNTVNLTASNVIIQTPALQNLGYSGHTVTLGEYSQGTNTWTIPYLAYNETAQLVVTLYNINTAGTQTLFTQVVGANQLDVDSTPNNNSSTTPLEDDEAVVSISFVPNAADQKTDLPTTTYVVQVSPNPATEWLYITAPDNSDIAIFDLQGKLVLQKNGAANTTIDIANLPKGMYLVRVNGSTAKFVKQ
ncbi:MAG: T9SS type A sorting domain-containing protein [Chitinophagales bacterium]|nr:T9SS type A sorting domain-containing protein [Chitinophagales bacterium]